MEYFCSQSTEKAFYPKIRLYPAHICVIIWQVLRDIDGGNPAAPRRCLIVGIMLVEKVLGFVSPEEDRATTDSNISFLHRPLPDVFKHNLAIPPDFVVELDGQVKQDDFAVQAILRCEGGGMTAKEAIDRVAQQPEQ